MKISLNIDNIRKFFAGCGVIAIIAYTGIIVKKSIDKKNINVKETINYDIDDEKINIVPNEYYDESTNNKVIR